MMGPTGVGKTEIARRLAKLVEAPLVKVEATKFTEVGYVGRDVESMVRDLVEAAIRMVKHKKTESIKEKAELAAENRILDILLPTRKRKQPNPWNFYSNKTKTMMIPMRHPMTDPINLWLEPGKSSAKD